MVPERAKGLPILVVEGSPEGAARLAELCGDGPVLRAQGREEANCVVATRELGMVLAGFSLPDGFGTSVLEQCRVQQPQAARMLVTTYDHLPELVRLRTPGLLHRVLSALANGEIALAQMRRIIAEHAGRPLPDLPSPRGPRGQPDQLQALITTTLEMLLPTLGAIVRPLDPEEPAIQLQLVIPQREVDGVRDALSRLWGWPLKVHGKPVRRDLRQHPLVTFFGPFFGGEDIFAATYAKSAGLWAYAALFPWRVKTLATVALGILVDEPEPGWMDVFRGLHRYATLNLAEFCLPEVPPFVRGQPAVYYLREYNWVVTPTYVGPERRERHSGFFSRYVVVGSHGHVLDVFMDQFVNHTPITLVFLSLAFLLLSFADAVFTWRYAGTGVVREANPAWRYLVSNHPTMFLVAKNLFSTGVIVAILRFRLFRLGFWALLINLGIYLGLNGYWLHLVASKSYFGN